MDLDRAIKDTFRKKGDPAKKRWPRFKAKDIGDGFRLPQVKPQDIDEPNGRVKLPKLGWLRYRRSRPLAFKCGDGTLIPGKVKQAHITKDCGKWFVTFATEFEIPDPVMKEKDVGIDVGIVHAVCRSIRRRERSLPQRGRQKNSTRESRAGPGAGSRSSYRRNTSESALFDRTFTGGRRMRSRRSTAAYTSRTCISAI